MAFDYGNCTHLGISSPSSIWLPVPSAYFTEVGDIEL